jgi:hypothetical protein
MIMKIIIVVLIFLAGYLTGLVTMAVMALSKREEAVEEALRMGYEMGKYESNTIDVTELYGKEAEIYGSGDDKGFMY